MLILRDLFRKHPSPEKCGSVPVCCGWLAALWLHLGNVPAVVQHMKSSRRNGEDVGKLLMDLQINLARMNGKTHQQTYSYEMDPYNMT